MSVVRMVRRVGHTIGVALLAGSMVTGCGGSGSSVSTPATIPVAAANNVVPVIVDGGPSGGGVNTLYTTVTVCIPGSTQCQTVDHVQVDTGSSGLRLLASVMTIALPRATAVDGNSLAECTQFVDGYSWGPVASADVRISGESASALPVQLIGVSGFASVPAACASGLKSEDTVADFGANGVVGIGALAYDCGADCVTNPAAGAYYSCSATACSTITAALVTQVVNPVTAFKPDNNGTIIVLPGVAAAGAATVSGSLIFGVDTETNNASGTQTVIPLDPQTTDFTTVFEGLSLTASFIDSGTNGLFFDDSPSPPATIIPPCPGSNSNLYCPPNPLSLSATLSGANGTAATVSFEISNADALSATAAALPTFGGTYTSGSSTFDWGLPFFYGRRVYTVIEGYSSSLTTPGPYTAF